MGVRHVSSYAEADDLRLLCWGAMRPAARYDGVDAIATLNVDQLTASESLASGVLEVVDPEGAPLASVEVEDTYDAPGGLTGVVGGIRPAGPLASGPFRRLQLAPDALRREVGDDVVTMVVDRPITEGDLDLLASATDGVTCVVLLALTGTGRRSPDQARLVRSALAAADRMSDARVVTVPIARRSDDTRDAVVVRHVVESYARRPAVWLSDDGSGESIIPKRSTPEGLVLLFTGLSGSGKSTLATAVHESIVESVDRTVTNLDGDVVRRLLSAGLTFSRADRETNVRQIGWVAAEVALHGGIAICSPIAPFDEGRKEIRSRVAKHGASFVLIHVATPREECERRDRKGLYDQARAGLIPEFTGISSPYEEPEDAEIRIDTTDLTVEQARDLVLAELVARDLLALG